jgi:ferredoxin
MQVKVDDSKCEAYGICAVDAPAVFELDEAGYARAAVDEVPAGMEDLARRAAVSCPMRAILATD